MSLPHIFGTQSGQISLSKLDDNFNYVFTTGSFTATLTGCTAIITGTAYYTITGNAVVLDLPVLVGTSNTTACTITGMPAAIQPASVKVYVGLPRDSGVDAVGLLQIISGTITLYKGVFGAFTNSGVKGLANGASVPYTLN